MKKYKTELRKYLLNILQMVENDEFPAMRNITDYVSLIIGSFDHELYQWSEKICTDYYNKRDKVTTPPKTK